MEPTETEDVQLPVIPQTNKRIVLENRRGVMAGIFQICCLESDAPKPLPTYNPEVTMRDHVAPACLVAVYDRYVLYREVIEPQLQGGLTFKEAQI